MPAMFRGSMTALITPMLEDGSVDKKKFQAFCQWQIDEGTDGLVPVGTTGESPTLSHAEHREVIDLAIEVAQGTGVPVIAGAGSNNTSEAISLTRHAKESGADAALIVTPYYNKPTQDGLYAHYAAIAREVDIPIVIYNIPGRSIIDMSVDTMARLARDYDNIIGVKDASNDLARPLQTRVAIGEDFSQLSGEDATIAAFLAQGGHGCISVSSNVAPGLCAKLHDSWQQNDWDTFTETRDTLLPVHAAMFCQSSPAPAKYGASLLDKSGITVRLPLVSATPETQNQVRSAMESAGLI